jgi:predicted RNA-binding protein with TRAM domain
MYGNNDRGGRSFGGPQRFAPVKVGDELDVKIEAVGEKGDGIAKKDGFVIFIPGVNSGDDVKIKVNKVLRKVGFAEVIGVSGSKGTAKSAPSEDEESEEEEKEISEEEMENDSDDFGEDDSSDDDLDADEEETPAEEEESK